MNRALYRKEEWLLEEYWHKKLSLWRIAKKYECSRNTLKKYMDKFNIPRRSLSEARLLNFPDRPFRSRKWLYKMYRRKKFSINQLSRLCRCDPKVIRDWLKKHGIQTRTKKEAYRVRSKMNLYRWYGSYWNRILLIGRDLIKSYRKYFYGKAREA